ncbi:MAG: MFS transporter, partial [Mycobacterium gordonae]|nr:MFS transporter [Mycobacterium gordonae]
WLTPAGYEQVQYVYSLLLAWITDKLSRSPGFAVRPDRAQVEAALGRVAYRVIAQRDWNEDTATEAIASR